MFGQMSDKDAGIDPATPRLELRGVNKQFAGVQALSDINFRLGRNEIVGLIGDNGAGKSTMIKHICGYHSPDSGEILFDGVPVHNLTVERSRELGVAAVYQERALADLQTLWRNIFIGQEIQTRFGFLDVRKMRRETHKLMLESMGFTSTAVTPESVVKNFSGGEKQGIAITRALYFDADIVILDEPAVGLSIKETDKLLQFIQSIKKAGKAAILIDHNIFHVYEVADRIVVLDRGKIAGRFRPKHRNVIELTEIMREIAETGHSSVPDDPYEEPVPDTEETA
jgi:simple sugar transport system ATP-binding protein